MKTAWRFIHAAAVLALVAGATGTALAQDLQTDPPGSSLWVEGPLRVSGRAPISLSELPWGDYGIKADGPGLTSTRSRMIRDEAGFRFLPWANATALLQPPGLAHLTRDDERGWVQFSAGSVSALG